MPGPPRREGMAFWVIFSVSTAHTSRLLGPEPSYLKAEGRTQLPALSGKDRICFAKRPEGNSPKKAVWGERTKHYYRADNEMWGGTGEGAR